MKTTPPVFIRYSLLTGLFLLVLSTAFAKLSLSDLQTDYQTTPLGIDVEKPRFSWQMSGETSDYGVYQTAYQIVVTNEDGKNVWTSEKINSGTSLGILYAGAALEATTRYTWTVTVWTNQDEKLTASSWFETGLMNPDPNLSAWDGATWIGGDDEDMVLYSHYLSVFNMEYQVQLDEASKSTKAAFVFGANDQRLMDKNLNLNGMEVGLDESYVALELDISDLASGGMAKLNVFRVGYDPEDDPNTPLASLEIPEKLINTDNQYNRHHFYLQAIYGVFRIFLDGESPDHEITEGGNGRAAGLNLNPYGRGGDFIVFPMVGDLGFWMQPDQQATFTQVQIRNYRQPNNALYTGAAFPVEGGTAGSLSTFDPSRNAAPMLRTEFTASAKKITKARIYATARGIYELYLNGERVSEDYFNPGLTQYNKTHLYQTYDVTDQIQSGGENALGAWMSEGWWSGAITFNGANWNYFGDRQSLLAKLVITYEDGSEEVVVTEPGAWKLYTDGPVRYGSFFQGEVYDATKEAAIEAWSTTSYNDNSWKSCVAVPLEGTAVTGSWSGFAGRQLSLDYSEQQLLGQIGVPVQIIQTRTAQSVEEVRPGVFVYDMGQNMVGFPTISIPNTQPGQAIRLRYAEVRYPDLAEYGDNDGMVMLENIRGALTQDLYISNGGTTKIQPRFTFHGFRFLEITGVEEALPLSVVQAQVLSSVQELASSYETSNSLVNRLWENITWSLRGNFLSIPTDTPARNERMGWNGDINVFSRASTWLANANQFLRRHLMAMRDMQAENGRYSDVAPVGNGFGGTLWGSAGIVVPWETYQQYGDKSLLAEHYESMKAYVNFLETRQNEEGILNEGPLGDWLSPVNAKNDNTMLWTAYQVYNLDIMRQVATILGKTEDAKAFSESYEERKAFLNDTYVDQQTGKTVMSGFVAQGFGPPPANPPKKGDWMDTQASYAIPLALNAFNEKNKKRAIEHLAEAVQRKNVDDAGIDRPEYSLMTGFIGTASMGDALSGNGLDDLAYRLVQNESYPSWLYPVKNGATTIWERLNSYTIEEGFGGNNSMNSFNHYSFGAVASWMYNYSLGIQRDPEYPGFKQFILQPTPDPDGQMTYAKGYYDSMYGRIVSEWYIEDGGTRYKIIVPPNTTATLRLKANKRKQVVQTPGWRLSGWRLQKKDGRFTTQLGSGTYEFFVRDLD
jgi:alpha-L-rhamnosidase